MKILFLYLILYLLFKQFSISSNINLLLFSYSSFIIVKINKTGLQKAFYSHFLPPDEIYINGINQSQINSQYDLNISNNEIKLVWNKQINNCYSMFNNCENITEIDLSHFDSSNVTSMGSMFFGCSSLVSVNFSNFNTSKILSMNSLFHFCKSLTSLDLSNFDTSQVTNMGNMFSNCYSLISLNLSNFDASKVESMGRLFYNCNSLIFKSYKYG